MKNSGASSHFSLQIGIAGKIVNLFWLLKCEKEIKHPQEVTAMQKNLEVAKSLVQTSSEQNQQQLNRIKCLSEEKSKLREEPAGCG